VPFGMEAERLHFCLHTWTAHKFRSFHEGFPIVIIHAGQFFQAHKNMRRGPDRPFVPPSNQGLSQIRGQLQPVGLPVTPFAFAGPKAYLASGKVHICPSKWEKFASPRSQVQCCQKYEFILPTGCIIDTPKIILRRNVSRRPYFGKFLYGSERVKTLG